MTRPRSAPPQRRPPRAMLLADALRGLNEGVIITERRLGREGLKIVFANAAFCRMTGYAADELIGRGHGFLHGPADLAGLRRWHRRLTREVPLVGENFLNHKAGARVYAAWTFSALTDTAGRITHLVGAYRDVTEKRRLQEALVHSQRLDAVGRLAGGVAHDFNNLLSVINGYCEILSATVANNPKAQKEVAEIHQAGQRATTLVRQLLAFSRRQAMDPRVINLNQLVQENAQILARLLAPDKTLQLSLDERLRNVRADPNHLQQVLLNLTINARDALAPGGTVTVSTGSRLIRPGLNRRVTDPTPGRYVLLSVSDNGCGMDAATQAQLFEPFFTTKGEGKGTGLGLALVYGIVQQSGGHIQVHSAPQVGSTFEIFLPEVREPTVSPLGPLALLPVPRGKESVLVAEPDEVIRKMVAGILTADGYDVLAASSADDALQLMRATDKSVHLVVVDPDDPEREGERLVRSLLPQHRKLRVLWTRTDPAESLPAVAVAAQAALPRPFALNALVRAVRQLLDGHDVGAS